MAGSSGILAQHYRRDKQSRETHPEQPGSADFVEVDPVPMHDPYLTAVEVASLLKLNVETIYDLIRKKQLPATKIGGQWRFDSSEIRDWFRTEGRNGRGK